MPTFETEEDVEEQLRRPCDAIRIDLKNCLLESECCRERPGRERLTPRQCLTSTDPEILQGVPQQCFRLKQALFECKRSLLDMRARFRGRKDG